jgi:hypothetical protein
MAPQEKDIVLAIHEDARMQLKPLVAKFKTTFTEKADKDVFMAIVKRVAKFVQEGEDRFVRLNDSTLDQYGLHAPGAGGGEGGGAGGGEREGEAPEPMAKDSSGSSGHDSGRVPVAEDGGDTSAASAEPASSAGGADGCASSSGGFPVVDEKLMRRLAEQSDK